MEMPGCHHTIGESENVSGIERAGILAVFVVDESVVRDGIGALTVLDDGWE